VIAGPRFEPTNLCRTESGEERLVPRKITKGGLKQFAQWAVMELEIIPTTQRYISFRQRQWLV
jgi:hypothetical protein